MAGLVVRVGVAGDRLGRRPMLIVLGLLAMVGGTLLATNANPVLVTLASGLAGVGRGGGAGGGGAWGSFFPAEQPLLAASVTDQRRTAVFGVIGFVGVLAAAAGSLVALVPAALQAAGWTWASADRLLLAVAGPLSPSPSRW